MSPPSKSTIPTVALVDTRWGGHHPTYLVAFTASLLRLGARVLLICQHPDQVISSLPADLSEDATHRVYGSVFIHRNHGVILKSRDHDPLSTIARWRATGRAVRAAETTSGHSINLVFFPYLDSYLRFAPFPQLPGMTLRLPWSGLYLRNGHLEDDNASSWWKRAAKGDGLLKAPDCRAICVLDERFNEKLSQSSGHPVISFPDMTDETPPDGPTEISQEILERAKGRKVIGLISMEKRKGLLTLLRASQIAAEKDMPWFFVATGPFARETFSQEDLEFCESLASRSADGTVDNLYLDLRGTRFQDGSPYNTLFTTFDVVWVGYENFEGSSNALTKAAAFRIPLVATAGQCIGGRVEHYQLGRTFPEADAAAAVDAIAGTLAGKSADGADLSFEFETYHHLHSQTRLDEIFQSLMKS